MALEIQIANDSFEIVSGKKKHIQAGVRNAASKKQEKLVFHANLGNVDNRGIYTAPDASVEVDDQIIIKCVAEDAEKVINVTVKPAPKAVSDIFPEIGEIKEVGSNGKYFINVQVVDNHGRGHKSTVVVTDFDRSDNPIIPDLVSGRGGYVHNGSFDTNDNGFVSISLADFIEAKRKLKVRVEGSRADRDVVLWGPKRKPKYDPTKGFWGNFFSTEYEQL